MLKFQLLFVIAGLFQLSSFAATLPSLATKTTIRHESRQSASESFPLLFENDNPGSKSLSSKKISLRDKIVLKLIKWKLIKQVANVEDINHLKKLGRLSLIFASIGVICILIPVGLVALIGLGSSIAGFILGVKSLKGNSNTPGIIGLVLSSLVILLLILGTVLLLALFGSF